MFENTLKQITSICQDIAIITLINVQENTKK